MQYGSGPLSKYEYACTVAASLAYLVLKQNDAVGCIAFDERIRMQVPPRSKRNHLQVGHRIARYQPPRDKTDMYGIFRERGREHAAAGHDGAGLRLTGRSGTVRFGA